MLSKDFLEEKFKNILNEMEDADTSDYDWYRALLWDGIDEDLEDEIDGIEETLAAEGIKYPDLHPYMRQIVENIIEINQPEDAVSINEEQSGGSFFAIELVLHDIDNVELLARHYQSGDPDHTEPEYYDEGIVKILNKYGWRREIYPLIFALFFVDSQHRGEFFTYDDADEIEAHLREGDNRHNFLKDLADWASKHPYDDYTMEYLMYLVAGAFDIDEEDDDELEKAVEKLEEMLSNPETLSADRFKEEQ